MIFYEEILKEFQKQKVKYVLVGGVAVNLLGLMRSTADLDILVEMSSENLSKIVRILKKKGYKVKQPVDPMQICNREVRKDWIVHKHMKAFNFYKDAEFKEVDIIIDSPVSFEQAQKELLYVKAGDIKLPVISLNHLIKMKNKAGREVDRLDVQELKRLKKCKENQ